MPKIIAVSASTNTGKDDQAREAGCVCLITKPLELGNFFKTLEKELDLVWERSVPGASGMEERPPDKEADTLQTMAADGDIAAILEWCARTSRAEVPYKPFARRIERLARQFRINEIKGVVTPD